MKDFTKYLLILANTPALVGVLFYSWGLKEIILLFWLETVVIGIFSILKTLIARPDPTVVKWLSKYGNIIWGYKLLITFLFSVLVGVYTLVTGLGVGFLLMIID
jgi:hypothetical protein